MGQPLCHHSSCIRFSDLCFMRSDAKQCRSDNQGQETDANQYPLQHGHYRSKIFDPPVLFLKIQDNEHARNPI